MTTQISRPFRYHERLPIMREYDGGFPVSVLSYPVCPPAIVGSVGAIPIDTINSHTFRPLAHIGKKVPEPIRAEPPTANLNTPSAVSLIPIGVRITAPLPHGLPDDIRRRPYPEPALSVGSIGPTHGHGSCSLHAAARCAIAMKESVDNSVVGCATTTPTNDTTDIVSRGERFAHNNEGTEAIPNLGVILCLGHVTEDAR